MAFKTITIKKEVYSDLIRAKSRNESFSQLFRRMLREKHPNLQDFYGAWELEKGEYNKITLAMKKFRKEMEEDFKKRHESFR